MQIPTKYLFRPNVGKNPDRQGANLDEAGIHVPRDINSVAN
jgi:hypothetical protein